ncbi:MAG: membrane protein insertase YidC [Nitrospirota bacterium]|nr:membrane protein insertase YidC [Nitrospirota bacterium]
MQRNTVLFIVLSMVILIGYPAVLKLFGVELYPQQQAAQEATVTPDAAAPQATIAPPAAVPAGTLAPAAPAPQATLAAPVAVPQDLAVHAVEVETDLYHAIFSTRGGVVTQWQLKEYLDDDLETPVNLFTAPPMGAVYPLTVTVDGAPGADSGVWSADRESIRLSGDQSQTLHLTWVDPASGGTVTKSLTFHGNAYRVDLAVETTRLPGNYAVSLGSNFGIRKWAQNTIGFVGVANLVDGDVHREDPDDMESAPIVREGETSWVVSEDKYFMAALMPETAPRAVSSRAVGEEHLTTALVMPGGAPSTITLYVGPKEYDHLKAFDRNLQENIDFGWFMFGTWALVRVLAEPMFIALKGINSAVGNWGVSIILLTLIIKTLFMPLTHKSYKSMRAMAAIQPLLKKVQEKHKDNKEKLGQETMALYKEHSINPLGGCLPIFIQIPFFIAFFNILYTAIELRHAPFMGWIADLSAKDPYYILPVVMGLSMFVQQKIQPSTMDPKQARIMLFLPVLFTFFFMAFPAGLVLYWLFNNLFTVTQQMITMKYLEKPGAAVVAGGKGPKGGPDKKPKKSPK